MYIVFLSFITKEPTLIIFKHICLVFFFSFVHKLNERKDEKKISTRKTFSFDEKQKSNKCAKKSELFEWKPKSKCLFHFWLKTEERKKKLRYQL